MIRVNLPREPYWLSLPGLSLRLKVRPVTSAIMAIANAKVRRTLAALAEDLGHCREAGIDPATLPKLADPDVRAGLAEMMFTKALARAAVVEWEGVLLPDRDEPAPVNDETVGDVMEVYPVGERFLAGYLAARQMLDQEKNASGPAPHGTSAAGANTARGATRTACRAAGASAAPTAGAAPRSRTRRSASKAPRPGTS